MALEIPLGGDVVVLREEGRIVRPDGVRDLLGRPDVELALLAFRVGVERGAERATLGGHLAREPLHSFPRAGLEQRIAGTPMRQRQQFEKLRIVVEHLLEMRHQPALVDRVAREAAAEMVVDAALADPLERDLDCREVARPLPSLPRLRGRVREGGSLPGPPQKFEQHRLREFRRAANAAVHGVDQAAELLRRAVELVGSDDDLAFWRRRLGQPAHQRAAVLLDALRLLAEYTRDFAQNVDEGRLAVAAGFRKIRAAPERLAGGRQEHGQWPATMLAHQVQRRHIDLVDVGPLFAIDLDVDEQVVHHRGGGVVLKALVRHHMAPVAGGIADREQDRLVGAFGLRQRGRVPGPPVDRIVLMLQEIRRSFLRQAVLVSR